MKRLPKQIPLGLDCKDRVVRRQLRERASGKKVRPGPGRPKKKHNTKNGKEDEPVAHSERAWLDENSALHITIRVRDIVPNLRSRRRYNVIKAAFVKFCGADDAPTVKGFRLVHFSVLSNHLHFIVEADSKESLSMGMQKLLHSISRRLNALNVKENGGSVSTKAGKYRSMRGWMGRIFSDRYYAHALKTPTEIANAIDYVLSNADRHYGRLPNGKARIAFTSIEIEIIADAQAPPPIATAKGYLLKRESRQYLARRGVGTLA